jgi:hypothetical protein
LGHDSEISFLLQFHYKIAVKSKALLPAPH